MYDVRPENGAREFIFYVSVYVVHVWWKLSYWARGKGVRVYGICMMWPRNSRVYVVCVWCEPSDLAMDKILSQCGTCVCMMLAL